MSLQANSVISCQTFGLEFETESLFSNDVKLGLFRPTHDASIESKVRKTKNGILLDLTKNSGWVLNHLNLSESQVIGTELVSIILDSNDRELFPVINNLCKYLQDLGEPNKTDRSGIHVHISFPNPNVTQLKSIMRLGRYFEKLFYHIGGMGYNFRGSTNDSIYCRPITRVGPQAVKYNSGWAQCFYIEDLIDPSKFTADKFWDMYGDSINHRDRYNPVRYTWLNLFNMYPQGPSPVKNTLEFRPFNHTLNPYFIACVIKLCSYFSILATRYTYSMCKSASILRENSIFDPYCKTPLETLEIFKSLLDREDVDDGVFDTARDILKAVPSFTLKEELVRSHLYNTRQINGYWGNGGYAPPQIYETAKKPEYVDIHVINGEVPR